MILDPRPARSRKKHLSFAVKKALVAAIDAIEDPSERRQQICALAASHEIGETTLYEWWRNERAGTLRPRARHIAEPGELEVILRAFYSHRGNATSTHRDLVDRGIWDRSLRSFQQYLREQVDQLVRRAAAMDELSARLLGIYISYAVPHRDFEWQIDLVDLCVEIDLPGGRRGGRQHPDRESVWAVAIVCKRTGVTRGWCLTVGTPTADAVVEALLMAIRGRTEHFTRADGTEAVVRLEGAPKILRCDNGWQLLAEVVQLLLCESGTTCMPAPEYQHTSQGAIERWNREAKRFSVELFGTTRGPKTIRDEEPFRADPPVMDPADIERLFVEDVGRRDRTPHRGETLSPLELYAAETYRGPVPSDDVLAQFRMVRVLNPQNPRRDRFGIDRGCVRYRNKRWTSLDVATLKGDTVELWQSAVDEDYLEIRAEGRRFRVLPHDELPADVVEEILEGRGERTRQSNRLRREGAAIAEARAEAANAAGGGSGATSSADETHALDDEDGAYAHETDDENGAYAHGAHEAHQADEQSGDGEMTAAPTSLRDRLNAEHRDRR